jgi:aspartyl aminopeptidase
MAKLSKKKVEELSKKLVYKPRFVWDEATASQRKEIMALGERFKSFISKAKTERMAVNELRQLAIDNGFKELVPGKKQTGKKFFMTYQNKVIGLVVLGKRPVIEGIRIVGAHLDSPRLDFKIHPLFESENLAFLKTHYYGGVKKYQWMSRPLALHGVICKKDGSTEEVHIGEEAGDPVFTINDLLPHLARKAQGEKKLFEAIEGERMNLVVGGLPIESDEGEDKVKLAVLALLEERYGITEEDLISAELEAVPAGPARDVGLDRALLGGYGQDDRVCSYCAAEAVMALKQPEVTSLALLVDKEEIGSEGSTGAKSRFLELWIAQLLAKAGEEASFINVAQAMANSKAISADVDAALNPDYPEVHDKLNAALMGKGIGLVKYTGSGGKYSASDANAEFIAWLRKVWDEAGVVWQTSAMGKIDEGGGGTIAMFLAETGMEVVDAGPALIAMHSPFEVSHKADIWSSLKAYQAFMQAPAE